MKKILYLILPNLILICNCAIGAEEKHDFIRVISDSIIMETQTYSRNDSLFIHIYCKNFGDEPILIDTIGYYTSYNPTSKCCEIEQSSNLNEHSISNKLKTLYLIKGNLSFEMDVPVAWQDVKGYSVELSYFKLNDLVAKSKSLGIVIPDYNVVKMGKIFFEENSKSISLSNCR